jgi:hypothetical protein
MVELRFPRACNPAKLLAEIVDAIPALAGAEVVTEENNSGTVEREEQRLVVQEVDGETVIDVPEGTDQKALGAVVDAHDPTSTPTSTPTPVEELNAGIQAATSMADIKSVFANWTAKHKDFM